MFSSTRNIISNNIFDRVGSFLETVQREHMPDVLPEYFGGCFWIIPVRMRSLEMLSIVYTTILCLGVSWKHYKE